MLAYPCNTGFDAGMGQSDKQQHVSGNAVLRAAASADIDGVLALATAGGSGLTNLPPDRDLLASRITASERAVADEATRIEPPKTKLVDVTGAGDCLAGTMIAALLSGFDFIECAKLGLAAASLTASKHGAAPVINIKEIKTLTATHNWNVT